jgi:hypothetical protein
LPLPSISPPGSSISEPQASIAHMFSISRREGMGNEPAVLHPLTFVIYGRCPSSLHRRHVVEGNAEYCNLRINLC